MWPFSIVTDHGFLKLMKTGRPDIYIPSPDTLSRDVKTVFVQCRQRMSTMLKEYKGSLSFATDMWTSPNHKPYVTVTVHLENGGKPLSLLLDIVEVARSHSGLNLAVAFATILEEFDISDKVKGFFIINIRIALTKNVDLEHHL
jgi:hypothetical protein